MHCRAELENNKAFRKHLRDIIFFQFIYVLASELLLQPFTIDHSKSFSLPCSHMVRFSVVYCRMSELFDLSLSEKEWVQ